MSGWIFSFYMVAGILYGPFVSPTIQRFGRRDPIMVGLFLYGGSFLCFAALPLVKDHTIYLGLGFASRFIQGIASTLIQTTLYSIITNFYVDHQEEFISYLNAIEGFAHIVGPLIAMVLYSNGGYEFVFYSLGVSFILSCFSVRYIFHARID